MTAHRVANTTQNRQFLLDSGQIQVAMANTTRQASTGKRIQQGSDDPFVTAQTMGLDIQLADSSFDTDAFLSGARSAYQLISTSFEKGDRAALRPLLSPDVYAAFDAAITARGDTAPLAYAGLKDARIVAASLEQGEAHITLAFTADFAADNQTRQVTDVWTFARRPDSADPNWTLVATSGDLPG